MWGGTSALVVVAAVSHNASATASPIAVASAVVGPVAPVADGCPPAAAADGCPAAAAAAATPVAQVTIAPVAPVAQIESRLGASRTPSGKVATDII